VSQNQPAEPLADIPLQNSELKFSRWNRPPVGLLASGPTVIIMCDSATRWSC